MALSAEAIISIVGTIINLPSCVLAFYHMCKGQKKDHHKDTRFHGFRTSFHLAFEVMIEYSEVLHGPSDSGRGA
ncbi:hypothetical protein FOMG_03899 [Fusarium oxysporum f. sp. melonis 26406]|uniref:Uncharacterized protein n=1 Tax=Fusarium oxysporum f. sp. melonis 26406 TaxID=1089452 RepID=X0AXX5_FUSOX|nr:hypothetical protein FOMG_03899 [Fusarium oxysporum f. sp. melonis 26406]